MEIFGVLGMNRHTRPAFGSPPSPFSERAIANGFFVVNSGRCSTLTNTLVFRVKKDA